MEPIILELEREENDLLIIAHESVLRVLYGYLMACNAADIPKLEFPRDEIIEVSTHLASSQLVHTNNALRSSPQATTMWPNASRFPIYPKEWSPAAPRTSRSPSLQAMCQAPCLGLAHPKPTLGFQHHNTLLSP